MDAETRRTWHAVTDLLGAKWACHVVWLLDAEPRGFNELRRELDVTAKTLSTRLAELRCLGFVEREVHPTSPPTTTYRLTEDGVALAGIVGDVEDVVEVVACEDGDCAVAAGATADCNCDCVCACD